MSGPGKSRCEVPAARTPFFEEEATGKTGAESRVDFTQNRKTYSAKNPDQVAFISRPWPEKLICV